MQNDCFQDFNSYAPVVLEYAQLASLATLNEADAERLSAILEQAENEPLLAFWLDEIDYHIGRRLGLFAREMIMDYQYQLHLFREYLGQDTQVSHSPRSHEETLRKKLSLKHSISTQDLSSSSCDDPVPLSAQSRPLRSSGSL